MVTRLSSSVHVQSTYQFKSLWPRIHVLSFRTTLSTCNSWLIVGYTILLYPGFVFLPPLHFVVHVLRNFTFSWTVSCTLLDSQLFFVYYIISLKNMHSNAKSLLMSRQDCKKKSYINKVPQIRRLILHSINKYPLPLC